jgi:hypothetical protein
MIYSRSGSRSYFLGHSGSEPSLKLSQVPYRLITCDFLVNKIIGTQELSFFCKSGTSVISGADPNQVLFTPGSGIRDRISPGTVPDPKPIFLRA